MAKKQLKNYINNAEFIILLKRYKDSNRQDKDVYNKLGKVFLSIAKNMLKRPNFINYTDDRKNDMISDACYHMIKYMHSFDLNRNNPFAYFSQITFSAFVQSINKVNRRGLFFTSMSYLEQVGTDSSMGGDYE